ESLLPAHGPPGHGLQSRQGPGPDLHRHAGRQGSRDGAGVVEAHALDDRHRRRSARGPARRRERHRVIEHLPVAAAHRPRDARVRDERRGLRLERGPRRPGHPAAITGEDGADDVGAARRVVLGHRRHHRLLAGAVVLHARLRHGAGVHGGHARPCDRSERHQGADIGPFGIPRPPRRQGLDFTRRLPRTPARSRRRALEDQAARRKGVPRRARGGGARVTVTTEQAIGRGPRAADIESSPLWNDDLAPVPLDRRTWTTYNIAALWIGMSVVITTYTLASGLMQQGMTWSPALVTILLGNVSVLIPMVLNAHAGTKYGVSFPVLCRASFGVRGANVPALLRAVVACGWFGIQTWIGGLALHALLTAAWDGWTGVAGNVWIAFGIFWL